MSDRSRVHSLVGFDPDGRGALAFLANGPYEKIKSVEVGTATRRSEDWASRGYRFRYRSPNQIQT
ncbi:MAG: hypothetical protein CMJ80_15880 [Planctomycetaceae bacterium]|nr:hypothetical protein [Planctomycetaceae bacterium]